MEVLKFEKVSFNIDKRNILENISFSVKKGDFFSIIGPNGAGKTTLIKLIFKIIDKNSGYISLNNKNITIFSRKEIAKQISLVSQNNQFSGTIKVLDFMEFARYPHLDFFEKIDGKHSEIIDNSLKMTNVFHLKNRKLSTLSGGEIQRVFIAGAIAQETEIIVLDEPVSNLDPAHREKIMKLLKKINQEENKTIIIVTHDINEASLLSNKILGIKNGKKVFYGTPKDLMKKEILKEIFDYDFLISKHPELEKEIVLSRL